MAVEVVAAVVVAPGRAGVGVSGCVLDVLERHTHSAPPRYETAHPGAFPVHCRCPMAPLGP